MKTKDIFNNIKRSISITGLKIKKHSPEILIATGVVGVVTSAVLACKATVKLNSVLEESKDQIDKIHEYTETNGFNEKYTEEDSKKDLTIVHVQTGIKVAKLYAPAVILGAASITAIISSHNILTKRNVALAAAYTAVDKSFKEYRGRVVERFGENLDRELKYGIKSKEIEETVKDENGEEKNVKSIVNSIDANNPSAYSKFFDELNPYWKKDADYNLLFLRKQQDFANEIFKSQGYLFLNDVYKMLGFRATSYGQIVGWVYDEKDTNKDNYIDFGLYNGDEAHRLFINGNERSALLDFNVDGNILDLI